MWKRLGRRLMQSLHAMRICLFERRQLSYITATGQHSLAGMECCHLLAWALVTTGVQICVLLMVRLCVPESSRRQDLCRDVSVPPLLVRLLCNLLCHLLLLLVVVEDAASIMVASVWALSVLGRRVMHFVEILDQGAVGHLLRIVDDLKRFGICGEQVSVLLSLSITYSYTHVQSCPSTPFGSLGCLCRHQHIQLLHQADHSC